MIDGTHRRPALLSGLGAGVAAQLSRGEPAAAVADRSARASEQRVWIVRNFDPGIDAFNVQPGQKLYLAPADASVSGRGPMRECCTRSCRAIASRPLDGGSAGWSRRWRRRGCSARLRFWWLFGPFPLSSSLALPLQALLAGGFVDKRASPSRTPGALGAGPDYALVGAALALSEEPAAITSTDGALAGRERGLSHALRDGPRR